MFRTVVCVKQIRHIYARTGLDPATHFIAAADVVNIVNPLDELAVEAAVRLRDAQGGGEVVVLTLGELLAEEELRRCLAMGADRLIRLDAPCFRDLDAWATGVVLAAAARRLDPDLVLCGRRALDDCSGQVPAIIAGQLGTPLVCRVVGLEVNAAARKVVAHRALDRGDREIVECSLPAVLAVDKGINEPRYPALPALLGSREAGIEVWDASLLGLDPAATRPLTRVVRLYPPRPRARKIKAPDSSLSAQARIQMLMGGGAAPKKKEGARILELPVPEAARKVLEFFIEHKALPDPRPQVVHTPPPA